MALLLRCLQEVRTKRGDPDTFVAEYPNRTRGRDALTSLVDQSSAWLSETLTSRTDTSCSAHYSDPRATAVQ
jgi:hypothetical protein